MDQHLVDHQLKEDGDGKADEVEGERTDRDIPKRLLLAQDLRNEPAKAERLVGIVEGVLEERSYVRRSPDRLAALRFR